MKAFIVLSLAATALALPGRGGRRQGGNKGAQKKDKMDPGNILRCAAENFGNNQTIKECLECFSAEMDFSSQGGLDAAKACASQFWPKGVAACGTEISAMAPGNMEALETVVECFDDRLEKENAERCLGEATSTELQGQMTEATMCILDSWKWAMGVVKAVNGKGKRQRGGRGRGRGKGKGKAMKKMMMKTLVDAHCDHASNGDATKDAACEKCFAEAVPSKSLTGKGGRGGRRGGRGKRAAKEKDPAILAAITSCSRTHLSPLYDDCTAIMEAGTDMKAAHKCYSKVLLGNVVSECIDEKSVSTADADSLNTVVECGVENVFEWLEEKNPKAAKALGSMLKKLGGDDDDDDE